MSAEAILRFGDDLVALCRHFDRVCNGMDAATLARVEAIPHQEWLDTIAHNFRDLGRELSAELDAAEA